MKLLVFVEMTASRPSKAGLGLLSHLARCFGDVCAIVWTAADDDLVVQLQRHGASRVIAVDALPNGRETTPADGAATLAAVLEEHAFDTVLASTTAFSSDVLAMLAARTESDLGWGLLDPVGNAAGELTAYRRVQGEGELAEVIWKTPLKLVLIQAWQYEPADFRPCPSWSNGSRPLRLRCCVRLDAGRAHADAGRRRAAVVEAAVIVSGGRGIGKQENLAHVRALAQALGGVAGASLPLVDLGWVPRSMQVSQTGTVVRPRLYVACGISGQIQHRVGIERSGTIIAINKDASAPIMSFCDVGVVADAMAVVPALVAAIEGARTGRS